MGEDEALQVPSRGSSCWELQSSHDIPVGKAGRLLGESRFQTKTPKNKKIKNTKPNHPPKKETPLG